MSEGGASILATKAYQVTITPPLHLLATPTVRGGGGVALGIVVHPEARLHRPLQVQPRVFDVQPSPQETESR